MVNLSPLTNCSQRFANSIYVSENYLIRTNPAFTPYTLHFTLYTLHHPTQPYTTLHNTPPSYSTSTPSYTTLHHSTPHYTTLHNTTPSYTTLHHTTQHYTHQKIPPPRRFFVFSTKKFARFEKKT